METTSPPDRARPVIFGIVIAAAASVLWGIEAMYTAVFRDWLAAVLGLVIGATIALAGRRLRGRALEALAAGLTALAWLGALYLAYFGAFLTEVSEHQGHDAADAVPVTLLFTAKFLGHFLAGLPVSLPPARLAWLAGGVGIAALLTRRRSA